MQKLLSTFKDIAIRQEESVATIKKAFFFSWNIFREYSARHLSRKYQKNILETIQEN